jgi:hypothetical protein
MWLGILPFVVSRIVCPESAAKAVPSRSQHESAVESSRSNFGLLATVVGRGAHHWF